MIEDTVVREGIEEVTGVVIHTSRPRPLHSKGTADSKEQEDVCLDHLNRSTCQRDVVDIIRELCQEDRGIGDNHTAREHEGNKVLPTILVG